VTTITPSTGQSTQLSGVAAITVIFNRAVIALGADWGADSTPSTLPFTFVGLSTPVPGKIRWVTTSIGRFDPDAAWVRWFVRVCVVSDALCLFACSHRTSTLTSRSPD
jgi:hypothetical protein